LLAGAATSLGGGTDPMLKSKRRQKYIDPKVQGAIVLRTIFYWTLCMVTIILMLMAWRAFAWPARPLQTHLDEIWFRFSPVFITSLLLLPVLIADAIGLSNRFAGPMVRLRQSMRRLADGERVALVQFRKNDFWQEFAEDFNRLVVRIQAMEAARANPGQRLPLEEEAEEETTAEPAVS
jgi:hypothetical protein